MSPTQRTLQRFRKEGYTAAVSEWWNPHTQQRKDLFGFIDVVALRPGRLVAIQATSGTNTAARLHKIKHERAEECRAWLEAGGVVLIVGWRKLKRGPKARRKWFPKVRRVTLEDLP